MPPESSKPPETMEEVVALRAAYFVKTCSEEPNSPIAPGVLDYTRRSLEAVDALLHGLFATGEELSEGLHVLVASYVFEVARREFGGRYLRGDPANPYVLVVGEPRVQIGILAFAKVKGRTVNGPEDSIPFFYDGIAPALKRGVSATIL
jgi:hypothetical protein